MTYGGVMVGLWMSSPEEARIMRLAMDERLRAIPKDDPSRPRLEKWRSEAMNMEHRAAKEEWTGWSRVDL